MTDDARLAYETNVIAIVRVTSAFLRLLRKSAVPSVINVSSGMGSFALTTQYAKSLPDIRFNAVDPGYTATDLNRLSGHQTVNQGTYAIVALATEDRGGDPIGGTGRFIDRFGPVPW